ncbi:MAG TPA: ATP-dependent sacrificial sulfur transferase LarE [Thermoplasmata archaeon]|nr:ATP-dependent sacrificial sulfur transferase LarE [Thermoplasmata archaeon]
MTAPLVTLQAPRPVPDVVAEIGRGGPALVALSGGVDSALVASLAAEALGARAVAVTLEGPAVSRAEVERARAVARAIGIAHRVVPVDPLARPEYRANPADRCYHCRVVETAALRSFGTPGAIAQYLDGVQLDDLGDDRPGIRAMDEAGFAHPLVWAGWRKSEVRARARERGLPNWDQPSDACLASRIAHGRSIDAPLLRRIESAEAWLRAQGFRQVRVRVDGEDARIEVGAEQVARLEGAPWADRAVGELGRLGFRRVTIDPRGYRPSGGPAR